MSAHALFTIYCFVRVGIVSFLPLADSAHDQTASNAAPHRNRVQRLPNVPTERQRMPKQPSETPQELSDLQGEPQLGLYNSTPWTMIIRVPGPNTAPMPTTVPPRKGFSERSIEPEILLVPREEPRFH